MNIADGYERKYKTELELETYYVNDPFETEHLYCAKENFNHTFVQAMKYFVNGTEQGNYRRMRQGELEREEFFAKVREFISKPAFKIAGRIGDTDGRQAKNDLDALMRKLENALGDYYILRPLLDDKDITDIIICACDDIRVRVKGKTRQTNLSFIDAQDYWNFIYGITIQNGAVWDMEEITFTDDNSADYKLRFVISHPLINCVPYPYVSIRKNFKKKLKPEELIKQGLMTEDVWNYLQDCAVDKHAVFFAGPPGSGKTRLLNAFLEAIPAWRDIVVIQENDELVSERKGIKFKKLSGNISVQKLCEYALVECANEFIIGEAKGGEMKPFATLLNSGGYGALTLHADNIYGILPKAADLIKYGSDLSYEDALKSLSYVDCVVFMSGYKVRAIAETTYNEQKKDFDYEIVYEYKNSEGE